MNSEGEISSRSTWAASSSAGDPLQSPLPLNILLGQKSKEEVKNQPPVAWTVLYWDSAFRVFHAVIIERQSEMAMPLLKNLAIFVMSRLHPAGRSTGDINCRSTHHKEVSTNLDNPRKRIRYSHLSLEVEKAVEYVAWAQDFLSSLHRAFKVQQGLVHSALPHLLGIWKMQTQVMTPLWHWPLGCQLKYTWGKFPRADIVLQQVIPKLCSFFTER